MRRARNNRSPYPPIRYSPLPSLSPLSDEQLPREEGYYQLVGYAPHWFWTWYVPVIPQVKWVPAIEARTVKSGHGSVKFCGGNLWVSKELNGGGYGPFRRASSLNWSFSGDPADGPVENTTSWNLYLDTSDLENSCKSCDGDEVIPPSGSTPAQLPSPSASTSNWLPQPSDGSGGADTDDSGRISFNADLQAASVVNPSALSFIDFEGGAEVIDDANGDLRQVKTSTLLADIVTVDSSTIEIRFYDAPSQGPGANGLYDVSALNLRGSQKIEEVSSTENGPGIRQTSTVGGSSDYAEAYGFGGPTATQHVVVLDNGERLIETVTSLVDLGNDLWRRTVDQKEKRKDANGNYVVTEEIRTIYEQKPWNEEVVTSRSMDPNGVNQTTVYTYYDNPADSFYGERKAIVAADGSWTKYVYDAVSGDLTHAYRPWLDGPSSPDAASGSNSRATIYSQPNTSTREVTETLPGSGGAVEIRKTVTVTSNPGYAIIDGARDTTTRRQTTTTTYLSGSAVADSTSTSIFYPAWADSPFAGHMLSSTAADGSTTSYSYASGSFDSATGQFIRDAHGTPTELVGDARQTVVDTGEQRTVTVSDSLGTRTVETRLRPSAGSEASVVAESTVYEYDATNGRLLKVITDGDIISETVYHANGNVSSFDASGVETLTTFDPSGDVSARTKVGVGGQADIVSTTSETYGNSVVTMTSTTSAGGLSTSQSSTRDLAGRNLSITDSLDVVTTYSHTTAPGGGRKVTVNRPGGVTEITEYYLDGQVKSVSGTGVIARFHDYSVNANGHVVEKTYTGSSDNSSSRWQESTRDGEGRTLTVEQPGPNGGSIVTAYSYNGEGRLWKTEQTGRAAQISEYSPEGRLFRHGLDMNGNDVLDIGGTDRVTEYHSFVESSGGNWWQVNAVLTYPLDGDGTAEEISRTRRQLATGNESAHETHSGDGHILTVATSVDRATATVTQTTTSNRSSVSAVAVSINGLTTSQSSLTVAAPALYQYDALGRLTHATNPRTGLATKRKYNALGQLEETLEPGNISTKYTYYAATSASAGRLESVENALGKKTWYAYDARGRMTHQWGATAYPLKYEYDAYGALTKLHTYQTDSGWTGATVPGAFASTTSSTTTWNYEATTGLLLQKLDDSNQGPSYSYHASGLLASRTWARGVVTNYQYNAAGELTNTSYSDGTTTVSRTYHRDGQVASVTDAAGTHTYAYAHPGRGFSQESIAGGWLDGIVYSSAATANGQLAGLSVSKSNELLYEVGYGYDNQSRLDTVTSADSSFHYQYTANSDRIASVDSYFRNNPVLSGNRMYDSNDRLDSIAYSVGTNAVSSHDYTHDDLHRRTMAVREDGSYWSYGYNDRNEVSSARKFNAADTGLAGWGAGFQYDAIGNRIWADEGGDSLGAGMRRTAYTSNSLNQYSAVSNAGGFDVVGTAATAASVTVNGIAADRQGAMFRKEVSVDNSSGIVRRTVDTIATVAGAGIKQSGCGGPGERSQVSASRHRNDRARSGRQSHQ